MRTTLNLPNKLLKQAQKAAHAQTKTETIILGLNALLKERMRSELLNLQGAIPLDLDIAAARGRKRA